MSCCQVSAMTAADARRIDEVMGLRFRTQFGVSPETPRGYWSALAAKASARIVLQLAWLAAVLEDEAAMSQGIADGYAATGIVFARGLKRARALTRLAKALRGLK